MLFLANSMIQKDPGVIVGPISRFLGFIIDIVFNVISPLTQKHSLGISIILLTIIVRFLMLPLAVKSQKSMMAMQKLTPEMEKIKSKYGNSKDPEIQKKMNMEIQALYAKHKVNPLSGCLPLFIQLPIFFALTYLMNQSFLFVAKLGQLYSELATRILAVPGFSYVMGHSAYPGIPRGFVPSFRRLLNELSSNHIPKGMEIVLTDGNNLQKILNKLTLTEWSQLFSSLKRIMDPGDFTRLFSVFEQKQAVELFFGLNLLEPAGLMFPGILIPLLAALTTFLTSYLSMKMTPQPNNSDNPAAGMQQKVMLFAMPIMMGFFTISYPSGVGLYWITSSVFQVVQQFVLNKRYGVHLSFKKEA